MSPLLLAATCEAALERQRNDYLHPIQGTPALKWSAPVEAVQPRSRRAATSSELAEPSWPRGPRPGIVALKAASCRRPRLDSSGSRQDDLVRAAPMLSEASV